jgi:hypothetical protein
MTSVEEEKWVRKRVRETVVIQGRSKAVCPARIPALTSKGAITRTVARAKRARMVGKDG